MPSRTQVNRLGLDWDTTRYALNECKLHITLDLYCTASWLDFYKNKA